MSGWGHPPLCIDCLQFVRALEIPIIVEACTSWLLHSSTIRKLIPLMYNWPVAVSPMSVTSGYVVFGWRCQFIQVLRKHDSTIARSAILTYPIQEIPINNIDGIKTHRFARHVRSLSGTAHNGPGYPSPVLNILLLCPGNFQIPGMSIVPPQKTKNARSMLGQ